MLYINNDPVRDENLNKPLLVLDLDETLIYSSDKRLYEKHTLKILHFYVYARPNLLTFINEMSKFYSLGIWSAGSDIYVSKIVERLFPEDVKFDFVWGRSKCIFTGHPLDMKNKALVNSLYSKDLNVFKKFGYRMEKILIVDDTPRVCLKNLSNAIIIRPFYGNQQDDELYSVGLYLKQIFKTENFQISNKEKWRNEIK